MKSLNQKKKELLELLVQYYELKPEKKWITHNYGFKGRYCALGHIREDFGANGKVEQVVREFTNHRISFINDGNSPIYKQPTPKQRVIAYLNDEIKKL